MTHQKPHVRHYKSGKTARIGIYGGEKVHIFMDDNYGRTAIFRPSDQKQVWVPSKKVKRLMI